MEGGGFHPPDQVHGAPGSGHLCVSGQHGASHCPACHAACRGWVSFGQVMTRNQFFCHERKSKKKKMGYIFNFVIPKTYIINFFLNLFFQETLGSWVRLLCVNFIYTLKNYCEIFFFTLKIFKKKPKLKLQTKLQGHGRVTKLKLWTKI